MFYCCTHVNLWSLRYFCGLSHTYHIHTHMTYLYIYIYWYVYIIDDIYIYCTKENITCHYIYNKQGATWTAWISIRFKSIKYDKHELFENTPKAKDQTYYNHLFPTGANLCES